MEVPHVAAPHTHTTSNQPTNRPLTTTPPQQPGEFFDGRANTCMNDLFVYTPPPIGVKAPHTIASTATTATSSSGGAGGGAGAGAAASAATDAGDAATTAHLGVWKQYTSPTCPPHRCSHQAVVARDHMWIFGGEFATAEQFYHFSDLWKLALSDMQYVTHPCSRSTALDSRPTPSSVGSVWMPPRAPRRAAGIEWPCGATTW